MCRGGPWIVEDWAGNPVWDGRSFASFEDAWCFIRTLRPVPEDWQEYEVVPNPLHGANPSG